MGSAGEGAPPAAYDEVAEAYEQWLGTDELRDDVLVDLVGEVRDQRVLALACGYGREARLLATLGARVQGVDLSQRLLASARAREAERPYGIRYTHGDAHTLEPFADASFDGVLAYMALMDIPDLSAALQAVARVLRPGGWFVFAITHPCFKPPASGELLDHVDGTTRRLVGRYFQEGPAPLRSEGVLPPVTYHRTLSTYVNHLGAAGLKIERFAEPAGAVARPVWNEVPCLLYARCQRS